MVFASKKKKINSLSIKIANQEISKVSSSRFLGVIIDDKLNWSIHINAAKRKASKGIGIICKARKFLKESTLITLYYSFIYPYLHYGILAWGLTYACHLDPLVKVQKLAARLITRAARDAPSIPLFQKLNILNLDNIYTLNVMLFMFKYFHCMIPIFEEMFLTNQEIHGHFTRQSNYYHSPSWHLEIKRRSIRVQGVRLWNSLANKINHNCSIQTFKYHIKKYLISCYSDDT